VSGFIYPKSASENKFEILDSSLLSLLPLPSGPATLYCLGGEWRLKDGTPKPNCISSKNTGKKLNPPFLCFFLAFNELIKI
jgi:hypothetical protein